MYPKAYVFEVRPDQTHGGFYFEQNNENAKNILNLRWIKVSLDLTDPTDPQFRIIISPDVPKRTGIIGLLRDRFISKDPANYQIFTYDPSTNWVISNQNLVISKDQVFTIFKDFFESLFEPDLYHALLPLHTKSLLELQRALIKFCNFKMPPVVLNGWTKKTVFFPINETQNKIEVDERTPSSSPGVGN